MSHRNAPARNPCRRADLPVRALMIKPPTPTRRAKYFPACRLSGVTVMFSLLGTCLTAHSYDGLRFSRSFLSRGSAEPSPYLTEAPPRPGNWMVDVLVNGRLLKQRSVLFSARSPATSIEPCIDGSLIRDLPLDAARLERIPSGPDCVDLDALVPGSTVHYVDSDLQLLITVPQAAQPRSRGDDVLPAQRDTGITAAFVDYKVRHRSAQGLQASSLALRSGFNLGGWHLRSQTWLTHQNARTHAESSSTAIERELPWSSLHLFMGQGSTSGALFDSLPFTGVRIYSDDRMLPRSERGYAPTVRGIAHVASTVTIRQGARIIRELSVPPGPFNIDDLSGGSFSGDLDVTVTGDDGSETRYRVTATASPLALRPGAHQLGFTAGRFVQPRWATDAPQDFIEGAYARGLSNHLTLLGGAHSRKNYQAVLLGAALSTPVGAVGWDIVSQRAQRSGESLAGQRLRLTYGYQLPSTGSSLGFSAQRFGRAGQLHWPHCDASPGPCSQQDDAVAGRTRQRMQWNISHALGESIGVHLGFGRESFWKGVPRRTDLQLGLQGTLGAATWLVTALRRHDASARAGIDYSLQFVVPLGRTLPNARASVQVTPGKTDPLRLGVSGVLRGDGLVSYNASVNPDRAAARYQANLTYQGSHAGLSASAQRSPAGRSFDLALEGSAVLHRNGLTLGRSMGEAAVLIEAPGAEGARVRNVQGLRVGRGGYALVSHATPYRWNRIDLEPSGAAADVDLQQSSQRVAPRSGSISRVHFDAVRERPLYIDAIDVSGNRLAFAAQVYDETERMRGRVAQGGVIRLDAPDDVGAVFVRLPNAASCRIDYQRPTTPDPYGLFWSRSTCIPAPIQSADLP